MPKLLLRDAAEYADRPAMRHKDFGIWQTWTWSQLLAEVRDFAVGLRKLGLQRGDTVAIIGDNRPRLYASFAAVQSLGGIPVPVYQDSVADEMAYVLEHAEVKIAIVQDQEQVDKVISSRTGCGSRHYDEERLGTNRQIILSTRSGLGREEMAQRRRRRLVARRDPK
jgi:long-chain acyl-CoA synthetase